MSKYFFLALVIALAFGNSASASETRRVHQLSMVVAVNDKTIMTPNVRTIPGKEGIVSVSDASGKPIYTLVFTIGEGASSPKGSAVKFRGELFEGDAVKGKIVASPTIEYLIGSSPSVEVGGQYSFNVVSHAVETAVVDSSTLSASSDECKVKLTYPASLVAQNEEQNCCSARCSNGGTLRCCNVISCCACGVCCHVP